MSSTSGALNPLDALAAAASRRADSARPCARIYLRPTAFVDSPFGHDGKVARLAGGLNWFAAVELIRVDGRQRVSAELVPVEGIERPVRR